MREEEGYLRGRRWGEVEDAVEVENEIRRRYIRGRR